MKNENLSLTKKLSEFFCFPESITIQDVRKQIYKSFSQHGELRSYKKGSIIFHFDDAPLEAYIVEDGRVKTYKITPEGKEVTFSIININEGLGIAELLLNRPRERYAEAICNKTKLWVMSKENLLNLIIKDKELCLALLWIETQHMLRYQSIVEDLAVLPVHRRVIHLLVRLSKARGRKIKNSTLIDCPLTHDEIAKMVGSSRQTITMILNELRDQGILSWEQKKIKINCWEELMKQVI